MGNSGKDFGMNTSNAASLKGKLQNLEVRVIFIYFIGLSSKCC